ncbi:MAG: extracellular solute-binding protein [Alphaproteobacteria bacterium]
MGLATSAASAVILALNVVALALTPALAKGTNGPAHGLAMHGALKYAADFAFFDYVNPQAPKGGAVVRDAFGTFDSLHPFIIRGNSAVGVGLIYDTLTTSSLDEPFSQYCLLCATIEVPEDRSWVEFTMRDDARWHDGVPISVDDVIYSYNILLEEGAPTYRFYYRDVASVSQTGPNKVRFDFGDATNPELPLIMGQLTILPKHYWETRDFSKTTLEPPLGSGAYRISDVKPGRSITYERVADYWGVDHPTQIGQDNFDSQRFDYFRDRTIAREAFKGGNTDIWIENSSSQWATAFHVPAVEDGLILKTIFPHERVAGMQGYIFNLRRPQFEDRRVREAIGFAFDFDWLNKNISHGLLTRTESYFDNSELGSRGLLADAGVEERAILEGFRGQIPEEVFTREFKTPVTDGSGVRGIRGNLRQARAILENAGWVVEEGVLRDGDSGEPLTFEILLISPRSERAALAFARNLKRLGIEMKVRIVDSSQYQARVESFDYDMIIVPYGQSFSPGNEQLGYWGSVAADEPGSRNRMGIKDPVIDQLIELIITAPDRKSLVQRTRALDRVLLWGFYLVPQFHVGEDRLAHWDKFSWPEKPTINGTSLSLWWLDPAKETALAARRASR